MTFSQHRLSSYICENEFSSKQKWMNLQFRELQKLVPILKLLDYKQHSTVQYRIDYYK